MYIIRAVYLCGHRGDGPAVTPMRPYYSHHDVYDCNAAVPMLQEQPSPERLSPREVKQEWYGETGGIKNIISCFQDHTDEVGTRWAILSSSLVAILLLYILWTVPCMETSGSNKSAIILYCVEMVYDKERCRMI